MPERYTLSRGFLHDPCNIKRWQKLLRLAEEYIQKNRQPETDRQIPKAHRFLQENAGRGQKCPNRPINALLAHYPLALSLRP